MARRQGLVLHKSGRRDPFATDYQAMWLTNERGIVVAGDPQIGRTTLDTVEGWLTK
jgi:hypothetical protein